MQNREINILNLIRSSGSMREIIAGLLGNPAATNREFLLNELPKSEAMTTLVAALGCAETQVFAEIHDDLTAQMQKRPLPPLTFNHLHLLATGRYNGRLSRILNCSSRQVLDTLLNANVILRIIYEFNPGWMQQEFLSQSRHDSHSKLPMEVAFLQLMAQHREIQARFEIDDFGWEHLIDEQQWFSEVALTKLQEHAINRGYMPARNARLLAVAFESSGGQRKLQHDTYLDALGILEVQRRVQWIISQLREQAQDTLTHSMTHIDADMAVLYSQLRSLIEFYELNAPAIAWHSLVSQIKIAPYTLREVLSDYDLESTRVSGTPKKDSHLQTRVEEVWSTPSRLQFWKKKELLESRFYISCMITEQSEPVDILSSHQISKSQLATLSNIFNKIPADMLGVGYSADLGKALLDLSWLRPDQPYAHLLEALRALMTLIVRVFVLNGTHIESGLGPLLWPKSSQGPRPFTLNHKNSPVSFPNSRTSLLHQIQQTYIQEGQPLKVVR